MEQKLSCRLSAVASFIPEGARVADIGTDHGFLPVYLAEQGRASSIIASDLRPLPLHRAELSAQRHHMENRITFCLSDGLKAIAAEECDTVVMAGMGGNTIREILIASPWGLAKHLILQPQTQISELRLWLYESGVSVQDAKLAEDEGRYYVIWDCIPEQEAAAPDPFEQICDSCLLSNQDKLLRPYLETLRKRYEKILLGIGKSDSPDSVSTNETQLILDRIQFLLASFN